jgi:ubiquitin C-terminal hydrolase
MSLKNDITSNVESPPPIALRNNGNQCYILAALQFLKRLYPYWSQRYSAEERELYFGRMPYFQAFLFNDSSFLPEHSKELIEEIVQMETEAGVTIESRLPGRGQEDTHAFLNLFLNAISWKPELEFNHSMKYQKPFDDEFIIDYDQTKTHTYATAHKLYRWNDAENFDIVYTEKGKEPFSFLQLSSMNTLPLVINSASMNSLILREFHEKWDIIYLQDWLKRFGKDEKNDGVRVHNYKIREKRDVFYNWDDCVFLQIKKGYRKEFAITDILKKIKLFPSVPNSGFYQPVAIICRYASSNNSGHFVSYVKEVEKKTSKRWFKMDDSSLRTYFEEDITMTEDVADHSYIIGYEKITDTSEELLKSETDIFQDKIIQQAKNVLEDEDDPGAGPINHVVDYEELKLANNCMVWKSISNGDENLRELQHIQLTYQHFDP